MSVATIGARRQRLLGKSAGGKDLADGDGVAFVNRKAELIHRTDKLKQEIVHPTNGMLILLKKLIGQLNGKSIDTSRLPVTPAGALTKVEELRDAITETLRVAAACSKDNIDAIFKKLADNEKMYDEILPSFRDAHQTGSLLVKQQQQQEWRRDYQTRFWVGERLRRSAVSFGMEKVHAKQLSKAITKMELAMQDLRLGQQCSFTPLSVPVSSCVLGIS